MSLAVPLGAPIFDDESLGWPESAGFVRPRRGIARGVVVAASILTLPLVAYHFQRVSLLGEEASSRAIAHLKEMRQRGG